MGKIAKVIKDRETHPAGTPAVDKRGSGPSANKITGPRLQHVHDHIESLAVTTSHYSRAHSPHHRYMAAEFTVKNLWDRYVEWVTATYPDDEAVNIHFYNHVFTMSYNIVARPPTTDICDYFEEM